MKGLAGVHMFLNPGGSRDGAGMTEDEKTLAPLRKIIAVIVMIRPEWL
jgi:hypothetical protein